ncbi:hypothetical protein CEE69_05050 [Rhodopirellula bahusiensis]|uniref:Uncharacterized protein n=1 Tax=Rhodopirellula bahusiensis TaxID=2014065 RepID=A0A2G1WCF2_9BACT|nr:hypothetical protein CEE69_05050 [Rhodopirellula bahusiensis]
MRELGTRIESADAVNRPSIVPLTREMDRESFLEVVVAGRRHRVLFSIVCISGRLLWLRSTGFGRMRRSGL